MKFKNILTVILLVCLTAVLFAKSTAPVASSVSSAPQARVQEIAIREDALLKAKSELDKVKKELINVAETAPEPAVDHRFFNFRTCGSDSSNILIIPSAESKLEHFDQINEDLMIMGRILSKQVNKQAEDMPYNPFTGRLWGTAGEPQTTFIDGYGVIFEMYVDFPLTPTEPSEPKEEAKEKDTEWSQTKKEIFSPQQQVMGMGKYEPFEQHRKKKEYNEAKVKKFENDLISSLKNACNIRNLDDDGQLIIVIHGQQDGSSSSMKTIGSTVSSGSLYVQAYAKDRGQNIGKNTMVIRVRKEAIDLFAEGDLDYDEFLEEIEIIKY